MLTTPPTPDELYCLMSKEEFEKVVDSGFNSYWRGKVLKARPSPYKTKNPDKYCVRLFMSSMEINPYVGDDADGMFFDLPGRSLSLLITKIQRLP